MASPLEEVVAPRHRSWPRRLLIATNIVVAISVVVVAGGYGYARWKFGQIDKTDLCHVLKCGDDPGSDQPLNVLVVGSDTRANFDADDQKKFGTTKDAGGQRSDTIILLRVDPKAEQAAMLSVPRDLFVPIAGTNRTDRINTAFEDGPDRLIQTIQDSLGVPVDHYVQVDFNGFRGIVEAVGGVPIYSPAKARDKVSGLDIAHPGCVTLDGEEALAFVRSRNYEYFENGRWRTDPTADLGRIQRQQDFVRRVLKKANQKARGLDIIAINRLVNTGIKNVEIDKSFSTGDISRLALRFKSLEPGAVQMLTIPAVPARVGGASVLKVKQPDAQEVIDTFLGRNDPLPDDGDAPEGPAISPARIRLRVLNGSGVDGQAGEVTKAMQELGFNLSGTGSADSFGYTESVISYAKGERDKALVVQSKIKGASVVSEDPKLSGADVVLTTGAKFAGVAGAGDAAEPTGTSEPAKGAKSDRKTEEPRPSPGDQC